MYTEHPSFKGPENKYVKIWRYMDLPKFLSLLESESLYFARADKLGDPFEGSFTEQNRTELGDDYQAGFFQIYKKFRTTTLVNCWHLNEHESEAMWKLYSKSNAGIAVQSTYSRLIDALAKDNIFNQHIGLIKYIDYNSDTIDLSNAFNSFVCKRKSFEHERELRAIICLDFINPGIAWPGTRVNHGLHISVDLNKLIEKIHVAPNCDNWILDLIKSLVKRHNLNFEVIRSSMDDTPLY